jgi:hypothetical protein
LHGANIGTGNQEVGCDAERGDGFGHLFGFVYALFRQVTFGVGRAFGVFAVDRDAVADDVQIHLVAPFGIFIKPYSRRVFVADILQERLSSNSRRRQTHGVQLVRPRESHPRDVKRSRQAGS